MIALGDIPVTGGVARVLGPFPFAFDTPGINNGVEFYTPTVGDVLLDVIVSITEGFNGTTPKLDVSPFNTNDGGWFYNTGVPVALDEADYDYEGALWAGVPKTRLTFGSVSYGIENDQPAYSPATIISAGDPLKIVVSQTGSKGGAAVGGSAGAGAIYLVVATPSLT